MWASIFLPSQLLTQPFQWADVRDQFAATEPSGVPKSAIIAML